MPIINYLHPHDSDLNSIFLLPKGGLGALYLLPSLNPSQQFINASLAKIKQLVPKITYQNEATLALTGSAAKTNISPSLQLGNINMYVMFSPDKQHV